MNTSAAEPSPRRFRVEPVETTTKVRRSKAQPQEVELPPTRDSPRPNALDGYEDAPVRRNFKPTPVETTTKSNRSKHPRNTQQSQSDLREGPNVKPSPKHTGRKFTPQLLETTKRSRKSGDHGPTLLSTDKTEASPHDNLRSPRKLNPARPAVLPSQVTVSEVFPSTTTDQTTSPRARNGNRRHSFVVPTLEPITSSDSDGSNCPSLSTSPSASSEEGQDLYRHMKKMRESCDDRFSGYLLDLAARAAEKQLREQAMAAFPNDDFHEPVDHFAIDKDSDASDGDIGTHRRSRARKRTGTPTGRDFVVEDSWETQEMQRHHERLRLQMHQRKQRSHDVDESSTSTGRGLFRRGHKTKKVEASLESGFDKADEIIGGWQKDVGLEQMRNSAKPPMLGGDLTFRSYQSPQSTLLDVYQYPAAEAANRQGGGGLWMGFCSARDPQGLAPRHVPELLATPEDEINDPIGKDQLEASASLQHTTDSRPIMSVAVGDGVDGEFSDAFVTQVYNYLSLGYPSLAKRFDAELSRISRVPMEELCASDGCNNAKGFVGLQEGQGTRVDVVNNGQCRRWKALRLYIREWVRQNHGRMPEEAEPDSWGARARRGSWAI